MSDLKVSLENLSVEAEEWMESRDVIKVTLKPTSMFYKYPFQFIGLFLLLIARSDGRYKESSLSILCKNV